MIISTPEHDVEGVIDHDHDYHTMNTRWGTCSDLTCTCAAATSAYNAIMYVAEVCSVKYCECSTCC